MLGGGVKREKRVSRKKESGGGGGVKRKTRQTETVGKPRAQGPKEDSGPGSSH